MNILIADGHEIVRQGVEKIIRNLPEVKSVENVADGLEALKMMNETTIDLAIMDIEMPGLSGLDILKKIKGSNRQTHVLLYSFDPQKQYAMHALQMGAAGFLTNDSVFKELATAIRRISCGERYVSA